MKNLREILVGLFTALASIIIVFGALSLSVAENEVGVIPVVLSPTATEVVAATSTSPAALLSEKTLIVEVNKTTTRNQPKQKHRSLHQQQLPQQMKAANHLKTGTATPSLPATPW